MPKNERIIERYDGLNKESNLEIWTKIDDLSILKLNDRIRIFEDKLAKDDKNPTIDAYITKLPKIDDVSNIVELEFETVNTRNERLKKEELNKIKKK